MTTGVNDAEDGWVDHAATTIVATADQVAQYNRDGYFVIERAFHPDTCADVTAALASDRGLVLGGDWHLDEPPSGVLRRFCSHPLLAGLARDFVGPEARVGGDDAVVLSGRPTAPPFGQHAASVPADPRSITCWIALTDTSADTPCLQIAPGLHRVGRATVDLTDAAAGSSLPTRVLDVPTEAGSVVVMSSLTPRRVRPGSDDRPSVAYAIEYVADVIALHDDRVDDTRRRLAVVRGGQLVGPT